MGPECVGGGVRYDHDLSLLRRFANDVANKPAELVACWHRPARLAEGDLTGRRLGPARRWLRRRSGVNLPQEVRYQRLALLDVSDHRGIETHRLRDSLA